MLKNLSTLNSRQMTDIDLQIIHDFTDCDGCTGVLDFYRPCCVLHDFHYRIGLDFDMTAISRALADAKFRRCMQTRSIVGVFSPMSWWRWAGVRIFGGKAWNHGD